MSKESKSLTIEDLPILKSSYVHMKNEALVLEKINKITNEGSNRLQVVTDFDLTLTKQHDENGVPFMSSFGIFRKSKQLPESYKSITKALYDKHRSIEIDPAVSMKDKMESMTEWMWLTHKNLQGIKFNKEEIDEVARFYPNPLRARSTELFAKLKSLNVPVLVFSAGCGDVVESILRQQNVLSDNVKIVSNFFKFDEGYLDGMINSDNIIGVFNKDETAINKEYFQVLHGRTNIILMGDSLGDVSMANGAENTETILRIGFLYDQAEENLAAFKDVFDIVLVDDQTMNVVLEILQSIA